MKTVRIIATALYYLSKVLAFVFLTAVVYATATLLAHRSGAGWAPMNVGSDSEFRIFYPFTQKPFLLGDYTASFIVSYFLTMAFYGVFLLLLSGVFQAFKGPRLFTRKGVLQLSRFY